MAVSGTGRTAVLALQALKIGAQVRRVLVAQVAVFFQRLADDPFELARQSLAELPAGFGSSRRTAVSVESAESPWNARWPVTIS